MDDEFEVEEHSYPWSWRATLVQLLAWTQNVLSDTTDLIEGLTVQVAADHNYRIDRKTFAESAAQELERLIGGEDG